LSIWKKEKDGWEEGRKMRRKLARLDLISSIRRNAYQQRQMGRPAAALTLSTSVNV
jgi:hypothetical protein